MAGIAAKRIVASLAVTGSIAAVSVAAWLMLARAPAAHARAAYTLIVPPVASFRWFPALPHPGERVLLVSTSTDLVSAITGFAWDLTETESAAGFQLAGPAMFTTFSTPAPHLVRLRVTAANGASAAAASVITMSAPAASVMTPFPVIRISARILPRGVLLRQLAVKAPAGAAIAVACRGRSCPVHIARRTAVAVRSHPKWVNLRRFDRFMRAGTVLQVRVSQAGKIGAYTRFAVRRRKLPVREDSCLSVGGAAPIACPS
jgi:hypothetical protein